MPQVHRLPTSLVWTGNNHPTSPWVTRGGDGTTKPVLASATTKEVDSGRGQNRTLSPNPPKEWGVKMS